MNIFLLFFSSFSNEKMMFRNDEKIETIFCNGCFCHLLNLTAYKAMHAIYYSYGVLTKTFIYKYKLMYLNNFKLYLRNKIN